MSLRHFLERVQAHCSHVRETPTYIRRHLYQSHWRCVKDTVFTTMPYVVLHDFSCSSDWVYLPVYQRGKELPGGGYSLNDEQYQYNDRIYTGFNDAEEEVEEEGPTKAEDMAPAANAKGRKVAGANRVKKAYEAKVNRVSQCWFRRRELLTCILKEMDVSLKNPEPKNGGQDKNGDEGMST